MTASPVSQPAPDDGAAGGVKIILVEDDHDLRQSMAEYLRLRNFHVTDVASGIAFYKALPRERYDIAVLDVNLPDISGFELARDIASRRDDVGQGMGIIMLTARTARDDRVRGYKDGADLYLTKPVDGEELALAILNLGRRVRSAAAPADSGPSGPVATTEDVPWRLDRQGQMLHAAPGVSIRLSAREVVLLEYLAERPGVTVSRDGISSLFSQVEQDPESRRLDAALARLRAKLKTAGLELPLQVVHGAGLRLVRTIDVV
ncbi:response regulator transcription factor [Bradyrhizobium sp. U87765 SZCCT0131]|uniref:response regulator transcription factor n=1 Tax=unclassified Bradyrhizobium TaxID=2631580 RepID=UPI001BAC8AEA|nr:MULTISPECIES: response regulator transcription factor [unclassified Bradyrhizobium]MBR1347404.1 response regulator transcription factor [Bradyrhizobium sp. U87765 SZCCT0048]MBR1217975.1 response regulator transcription factor [Bradyrhizobium sp. U87765 SZCCT0131]MBR1261079.1 response regulator transcription factor [Bradyrhizobium sp. U87765 SZCCT0134]MBR1303473.1 response regulator transcription factor [Bradyrhizobium sp. U87765 SZCCT0110]MBR1319079.1 response regulator transcription factor